MDSPAQTEAHRNVFSLFKPLHAADRLTATDHDAALSSAGESIELSYSSDSGSDDTMTAVTSAASVMTSKSESISKKLASVFKLDRGEAERVASRHVGDTRSNPITLTENSPDDAPDSSMNQERDDDASAPATTQHVFNPDAQLKSKPVYYNTSPMQPPPAPPSAALTSPLLESPHGPRIPRDPRTHHLLPNPEHAFHPQARRGRPRHPAPYSLLPTPPARYHDFPPYGLETDHGYDAFVGDEYSNSRQFAGDYREFSMHPSPPWRARRPPPRRGRRPVHYSDEQVCVDDGYFTHMSRPPVRRYRPRFAPPVPPFEGEAAWFRHNRHPSPQDAPWWKRDVTTSGSKTGTVGRMPEPLISSQESNATEKALVTGT